MSALEVTAGNINKMVAPSALIMATGAAAVLSRRRRTIQLPNALGRDEQAGDFPEAARRTLGRVDALAFSGRGFVVFMPGAYQRLALSPGRRVGCRGNEV
jgi:hypothetical protein